MNLLPGLPDSPLVLRIGWVLVHSLWQVAAIAVLLALVLSIAGKRSARFSYAACCVAMMLALGMSIATFIVLPEHAQLEPAAPSAIAPSSREFSGEGKRVIAEPADFGVAGLERESREKIGRNSEMQPPAESDSVSLTPLSAATESVESIGRWFDKTPTAWLPWAVLAWFMGVAGLSIWNVGGWLTVQRLKTRATARISLAIQEAATRIAGQLGLTRSVQLLQSTMVDSPQVIGAVKPLILLPASLLCQLPPDQLESLLAHELAHILRQDYLVNLLQCAIETIFFYHPAIWWISAQTRQQREYCCDDIAVSVVADRAVYVRALAAVAGARTHALAPASSSGRTVARLQRILETPTSRAAHPSRWLIGLAALTLCATETAFLAVRSHSAQAQVQVANAPEDADTEAEARAIEAINKLKGQIRRDITKPGHPVVGVSLQPGLVIRGPGVTDAVCKDLQAFKHLKSLNMMGAPVTDEGMKSLKQIKSIEVLHIGGTQIGDQGLKELNGLKNLKVLDLYNAHITDAGLANLKDLPKLETLNLRHTPVTDAGVKALKNLPSLQSLELSGAQVTERGLHELESLKNLRSLILEEPSRARDGLMNLAQLKGLTLLQLNGGQIKDAVLASVRLLPHLESLAIANADVTDDGIKMLNKHAGLKYLAISNTLVTDDGLKEIRELKNLQDVSLVRSAFTDAGLMHLKELKNLQRVNLNGTNVSEAGVRELQKALPNCRIDWRDLPGFASDGSSLPRVPSEKQEAAVQAIRRLGGLVIQNTQSKQTMVTFNGYQVTDEALKNLPDLQGVVVLGLQQSSVTDAGLAHLRGLANLQMLSFRYTRITDKGLQNLKGFKNLVGLNLGYTKATVEGVRELQRALPRCRIVGPGPTEAGEHQRQPSPQTGRLVEDEVGENLKPPATPDEARAIETIKRLGGRVTLGADGTPYLLNFSYTALTDGDLKLIKKLGTVRQIIANNTGITDAGLKELQAMPRLRWLMVGNTKVTKQGLDQLKAALPECEVQEPDIRVGEGRRGSGRTAEVETQNPQNAPATEKERVVIAAVQRLGGRVQRDSKLAGNPVIRVNFLNPAEITPAMLKDLAVFKTLKALALNAPDLGNDDLHSLENLPNLETLSLTNTAVTDAGIPALKKLKKLRDLGLQSVAVTGSTLKELSDLHGLTLGGPQITDASLRELKNLPNLESLILPFTSVTDAGLKELEALDRLKELYLVNSGVHGEGLRQLRSLKNLRALSLAHSEITDAGLAGLRDLVSLEKLDLISTNFSDQGLRELYGLKNLKELNLLRFDQQRITLSDSAVEDLQKALPNCQITGPKLPRTVDGSAPRRGARAAGGPLRAGRAMTSATPSKPVPAEKEKPAVQMIERLGGQITREPEVNGQITQVDMRGTHVKDTDLKVIKELTNLQTLYLGQTQITDAGLAELKDLKNLRFLGLNGAKVTADGVKALRTALPDCSVASPLGR